MKSALTVSLLVSIASLSAGTASAESTTYKSKMCASEVAIPKDWKTGGKPDVLLTAVDKKEEVALVFMCVEKSDVEPALKELEKEVGPLMKDQKWGKAKEFELNGMKGMAMDGTAKVQGKAAEVTLVILKTANKKGLILFGGLEAAKKKSHEAELLEILKSLKPTK